MSITNEKLQTIKDNVSKVYRSGQMDVIKNANSLKGFESNKAILLDDISPVTHEMGVKVRSKNLLDIQNPLSTAKDPIITYNSITATKDLAHATYQVFLVAGDYTISFIKSSFASLTITDSGGNVIYNVGSPNNVNYTFSLLTNDTLKFKIGFGRFVESGITSITVSNVQLELSSTATTYTPYVPDLTAVKVSRYGKNLLDIQNPLSTAKDPIITYNSITATKDLAHATYQVFLVAGDYTISFIKSSFASLTITDSGGNVIYNVGSPNNVNYTFSLLTNDTLKFKIGFGRFVESGITSITVSNVQLELSSTATYYEPYITPTEYTPNADGTVNGVTSLYPNTTLMTDTDGVIIDCEYYKDIDKAYNKLSAAIALSGGE